MNLKKIITIILLIGFALPIFCQQIKSPIIANGHVVKGIVSYSSSGQKLQDASVVIFNSADSIIKQFTRTQSDGSFLISGMKNGHYLLYISYPGYVDYIEQFALDSNQTNKDFSIINLMLKANLLKEVLINGNVSTFRPRLDLNRHSLRFHRIYR